MKLLVSTHERQGFRESDFNFVPDGEIVVFGDECDEEHVNLDEGCGCKISMMGSKTRKGTTTTKVEEMNISEAGLNQLLMNYYINTGIAKPGIENITIKDEINQQIKNLTEVANSYEIGTILERRGKKFGLRDKNYIMEELKSLLDQEKKQHLQFGEKVKEYSESELQQVIPFKTAQIERLESLVLQDLELLIKKKKFKVVDKVQWNDSMKFSLENNCVFALAIFGPLLKFVPESIGYLKSVKKIYLGANTLKFLPDSIGHLKSLQTLNLEDNKLNDLPESIGHLSSLNALFLQNNKLTTLPTSIGNLKSLQTLKLGFNKLNLLPSSMSNLKSLTTLYLHDNKLTQIPDSLGQLSSIEDLDLRNNELTSFPEFILRLESIDQLYLNGNKISAIPESILNLKSLKYVNFSKNPVADKPDANTKSLLKKLKSKKIEVDC